MGEIKMYTFQKEKYKESVHLGDSAIEGNEVGHESVD
jgi:hypothetical protein